MNEFDKLFESLMSYDVSLECVCADDFGAGFVDEGERTDEERDAFEKFVETKEAHENLENLADQYDIRNHIVDTSDGSSNHNDAYLYFNWSELHVVLKMLEESGAVGDVLDVPIDFPEELVKKAESLNWTVERKRQYSDS